MRWIFLFGFILLMVFGCSTATYREEFQLKEGEKSRVHDIKVNFVKVLEDSRCPMDTQCVWQGIAVVELEIFHDGKTYDAELATMESQNYKTSFSWGPYSVQLIELQPQPEVIKTMDKYVATLVVG